MLIDEWRARGVRPEVVADEVPELASPDHADAAVQSWLVADALPRLSRSTARCCSSATTAGCGVAQAAAARVPAGTVKSRTYYALRALRLALEERGWRHDGPVRVRRRPVRPRRLPPEDRRAFEEHLAAARSAGRGTGVAGLPGLLSRLPAGELPAVLEGEPEPPAPVSVLPSLLRAAGVRGAPAAAGP